MLQTLHVSVSPTRKCFHTDQDTKAGASCELDGNDHLSLEGAGPVKLEALSRGAEWQAPGCIPISHQWLSIPSTPPHSQEGGTGLGPGPTVTPVMSPPPPPSGYHSLSGQEETQPSISSPSISLLISSWE